MDQEDNPIGIFDSGLGGLSVLKEIQELLPGENLIYFADQKNVPYGERNSDEIFRFSEQIVRYFNRLNTKLIVVACNTASAAALDDLRIIFPGIPFVGMEPAVKPATENTKTGVVGVLATPGTINSQRYASLLVKFAGEVNVLENACDGLVKEIEKGDLQSEEINRILKKALLPMVDSNADTIVLGCTHYPFVRDTIQKIAGQDVQIINPAPAIARQVERLLTENQLLINQEKGGETVFLTSGEIIPYKGILKSWGFEGRIEKVELG